jgi:hypothetical protein
MGRPVAAHRYFWRSSCLQKLINESHLALQRKSVVIVQLILEVYEMPVNGVGRVRDAQFMMVIPCEQSRQVVADAPVGASQSFVSVEAL